MYFNPLSFCFIQLFSPAILGHRWVCYAWDLQLNTVTIFYPEFRNLDEKQTFALHKHLVNMLKNAVRCTMHLAFKGWGYKWESASIEVIRPPMKLVKRYINNRFNRISHYMMFTCKSDMELLPRFTWMVALTKL